MIDWRENNITDSGVVELIESFYTPLDPQLAELRAASEKDRIPLILRETENYLTSFLKVFRPARILEIGTAYGYSAAFFARLLPECTVTTIERSPEMAETAVKNFEELGLSDRISILEGEALETLDSLASVPQRFDFVFIDAAKSHYREFFEASEKLCGESSVVICDNVLMRGSVADGSVDPGRRHRTSIKRMREFLQYLHNRKDLTVSLLSCGDGLAVIESK